MPSQDWEKFGEDIRKTVQDAIDAQDFNKLNQTISNTVNDAIDSVRDGLFNAGSNIGRNFYGNEKKSFQQQTPPNKIIQPYEYSQLFSSTVGTKVLGILLCIVGGCLGIGMLVLFMLVLIAFAVVPTTDALLPLGLLGFLSATGGLIALKGASLLGRAKRFRIYIEEAKKTGYCEIKKLAVSTKKSIKFIRKDLNRMISKGWFKQAHFDEQKTSLMVNNRLYEEYKELMKQRRELEVLESEQAKRTANQAEQRSSLDPQILDILDTGNEYIQEIHACNAVIPRTEISAKISRMEELVDRIFDRVEQHPESVSNIRRLMDYYLPTTVKLLHAYEELDQQPIQGENIQSSKVEIEHTLDTLNIAFEKLLDDMFQHTAWDVSSDISVLNAMLAQEGLAGDDFKKD